MHTETGMSYHRMDMLLKRSSHFLIGLSVGVHVAIESYCINQAAQVQASRVVLCQSLGLHRH